MCSALVQYNKISKKVLYLFSELYKVKNAMETIIQNQLAIPPPPDIDMTIIETLGQYKSDNEVTSDTIQGVCQMVTQAIVQVSSLEGRIKSQYARDIKEAEDLRQKIDAELESLVIKQSQINEAEQNLNERAVKITDLEEKKANLEDHIRRYRQKRNQYDEVLIEYETKNQELSQKESDINHREEMLIKRDQELNTKYQEIEELQQISAMTQSTLEEKERELNQKDKEVDMMRQLLEEDMRNFYESPTLTHSKKTVDTPDDDEIVEPPEETVDIPDTPDTSQKYWYFPKSTNTT